MLECDQSKGQDGGSYSEIDLVVFRIADGFFAHPFSSRKSLLDNTLPSLEKGLAKSGRSREDLEIICATLTVTADDEQELARRIADGDVQWQEFLEEFYRGPDGFETRLEEQEQKIDPREASTLGDFDDLDGEVRIGRYGPFLELAEDGDPLRVSLPEGLAPADLSPEKARISTLPSQSGAVLRDSFSSSNSAATRSSKTYRSSCSRAWPRSSPTTAAACFIISSRDRVTRWNFSHHRSNRRSPTIDGAVVTSALASDPKVATNIACVPSMTSGGIPSG